MLDEKTSARWVAWMRASGLETPAWLGLEVLRLGTNLFAPVMELLEPFWPAEGQRHFLAALSSMQRELEGKPEA